MRDAANGESGYPGGQRQRIGIARALYKRASILILDEATSALDNATEKALMDSISALASDITIVMIAHRLRSLPNAAAFFSRRRPRNRSSAWERWRRAGRGAAAVAERGAARIRWPGPALTESFRCAVHLQWRRYLREQLNSLTSQSHLPPSCRSATMVRPTVPSRSWRNSVRAPFPVHVTVNRRISGLAKTSSRRRTSKANGIAS